MFRLKSTLVALVFITILTLLATASVSAAAYSFSGNILSGAQYDLYTVNLVAGEQVTATLVCDEIAPGNRPLDPVLSVFFPGSDTSSTNSANIYNDDGFGSDDDPAGVDCNAFDSSRVMFGAPVTGVYTFRADGFGSATGPYTLRIVTGSSQFGDARINPQQDAPIVLYCSGTATNFYSVTGVFLGTVEAGGSAALGGAEITPTGDGGMQLVAGMPGGKAYMFVWSGCPRGTYSAYSIENGVSQLYSSGSY